MQIGMGGMTKTDLATSEETNWHHIVPSPKRQPIRIQNPSKSFPTPSDREPANDAQTWSQPVITAPSLKSPSSMMVKVSQPT